MNIIQNSSFFEFILCAKKHLNETEASKRYYHTLTLRDNKPEVVHYTTDQCSVVTDGSGNVELNGEKYSISKGDIIFISAGTKHCFYTNDTIELFHIHIPDSGRDDDRAVLSGDDYNRFSKFPPNKTKR